MASERPVFEVGLAIVDDEQRNISSALDTVHDRLGTSDVRLEMSDTGEVSSYARAPDCDVALGVCPEDRHRFKDQAVIIDVQQGIIPV